MERRRSFVDVCMCVSAERGGITVIYYKDKGNSLILLRIQYKLMSVYSIRTQ